MDRFIHELVESLIPTIGQEYLTNQTWDLGGKIVPTNDSSLAKTNKAAVAITVVAAILTAVFLALAVWCIVVERRMVAVERAARKKAAAEAAKRPLNPLERRMAESFKRNSSKRDLSTVSKDSTDMAAWASQSLQGLQSNAPPPGRSNNVSGRSVGQGSTDSRGSGGAYRAAGRRAGNGGRAPGPVQPPQRQLSSNAPFPANPPAAASPSPGPGPRQQSSVSLLSNNGHHNQQQQQRQQQHPSQRSLGQQQHPSQRSLGQQQHPSQRSLGQQQHPSQRSLGQQQHPSQRSLGQQQQQHRYPQQQQQQPPTQQPPAQQQQQLPAPAHPAPSQPPAHHPQYYDVQYTYDYAAGSTAWMPPTAAYDAYEGSYHSSSVGATSGGYSASSGYSYDQ